MGANRIIILVAIALVVIAVYIPASGKEIIAGNDSEADFSTIQEAVNNSFPGDTVIVRPGTYTENVIVNVTRLTVRSESGKTDVLIKPFSENESIFHITADNVTITGFNLTGAGESFSSNGTYYPVCGIYLGNSSNCTITGNTLFENGCGISLYNASNNTISENLLFNDSISMGEGGRNGLINNTIEEGFILFGSGSSGNLISKNKISNGRGISFACCGGGDIVSENTISNCSIGIGTYDRGLDIINNRIIDCGYGVDISQSSGTRIHDNRILNCRVGIDVTNSGIEILNNTIISSAECGISIPDQESDERICNNYFNNTLNIRLGISEGNTWNDSLTTGTNIVGGPFLGGNFWANPNGTGFSQISEDFDLNGICDAPYEIDHENIDYLPLSTPPESVPLIVGDDEPDADYSSIQRAVSAAVPGSTILVYPGTYIENVDVNVHDLKIYSRSINSEEVTIEALNPEDSILHVGANNITICGFTVKGTGEESKETAGIYLDSVYGCNLCNNTVLNNRNGIFLSSSDENILRSNNVTENTFGIVLLCSNNNTVIENVLVKNSAATNKNSGIYLNSSDDDTLVNSTMYYSNSPSGIAIFLSGSGSNILQDNEIWANFYGILAKASENNTVTRNNLRENTACGVTLSDSNRNSLYDNYFNNTINVKMEKSEINHWNINMTRGKNFVGGPYLGGNFWAKPDGSGFSENAKDSDIDGISDSAYIIESTGITDSFPLTRAPKPVLLIENGVPVKDFSRIQDAVDSATLGSTIVVYPGTYKENIIVDMENISIVSESGDPGNTVIKTSNTTEDVINVTSKGVKISGFHIDGPEPGDTGKRKAGICLYNTSENTIDNNVFSEQLYAVYMVSSNSNNIINNSMEKNERGLYLEDSESNSITNNMVLNNIEGAVLNKSGNNSLLNNNISLNRDQGIYIYSYIYSDDHDSAGSNLIKDNLISGNNYGIYTSFSENNTVWNNIINLNSKGILLSYSSNNLFRDNLIESSRYSGLYTYSGSNNTFYNNLFNNTLNLDLAYGNKNTSWNITKISGTNIVGGPYSGGNFWAKPDGTGFSQNCTDLDKDGICDYPYEINESEFDYLPLSSALCGDVENGCSN